MWLGWSQAVFLGTGHCALYLLRMLVGNGLKGKVSAYSISAKDAEIDIHMHKDVLAGSIAAGIRKFSL